MQGKAGGEVYSVRTFAKLALVYTECNVYSVGVGYAGSLVCNNHSGCYMVSAIVVYLEPVVNAYHYNVNCFLIPCDCGSVVLKSELEGCIAVLSITYKVNYVALSKLVLVKHVTGLDTGNFLVIEYIVDSDNCCSTCRACNSYCVCVVAICCKSLEVYILTVRNNLEAFACFIGYTLSKDETERYVVHTGLSIYSECICIVCRYLNLFRRVTADVASVEYVVPLNVDYVLSCVTVSISCYDCCLFTVVDDEVCVCGANHCEVSGLYCYACVVTYSDLYVRSVVLSYNVDNLIVESNGLNIVSTGSLCDERCLSDGACIEELATS